MTITKRNGKYYCRFQIDGERHHYLCAGATDEKQAKKIEQAFMYKVQQQQNGVIPKEDKNITLSKLMTLYSNYAKINNKDSKRSDNKIDVIQKFFGLTKKIKQIKKSDVEDFRQFLKDKKKLAPATINRYVCVLSKAFNLAIDDDIIEYNPCRGVKKLKEDNEIIRYLTKEEEIRLYEVLPLYLKPIVVCALQTGLRKDNILHLRWEQIDIEYGFIEIEKQNNKGHKQIRIPITETLLNEFKAIGIKSKGYVFINPLTEKPYNTIHKSWTTALKAAKIENFRFHDLRHTVGTRLIEKGVDIKTVQELFAHSSIITTQRYLHTDVTRKQAAMQILNSYN